MDSNNSDLQNNLKDSKDTLLTQSIEKTPKHNIYELNGFIEGDHVNTQKNYNSKKELNLFRKEIQSEKIKDKSGTKLPSFRYHSNLK